LFRLIKDQGILQAKAHLQYHSSELIVAEDCVCACVCVYMCVYIYMYTQTDIVLLWYTRDGDF